MKNKISRAFPKLFRHKSQCCGCTACFAICSQKAINMIEDMEGFEYPIINKEKCVKCYRCMSVCPFKVTMK